MDKKYERNLEKSFNDFQKRYYSMDGRPQPHRRPDLRKMRTSQFIIDAKVNSVPTKRKQTQEDSAMARADATNAVKKRLEAEKRQSKQEQSMAQAEKTRRDMRERAQGYDDKIRNLQHERSVGSGPASANPYEKGLSKQMIAGSVASGRTRKLEPVVPEQVRANRLSRISKQHKANRRSTLPVEQIPISRDRPIDLSVSATGMGARMRSLTRGMSNLNVGSE